MNRTAAQIRQEFIDFFCQKHGHAFVRSSPVVPHDDPTLLFTNAGMNQFKPYFLGTEKPTSVRVANTQKCIRAGGKHNDLDDVGHDTYHHTFFEMLGNWSFGDYFKTEAIAWAWELLVDVWDLDPTRLHATFFEGDESEGLEPDNEAKELWLKILPPERVHPGNKKDNFWEMGDTGPCGPCSEIHIDLTPDKTGGPLVNAGDASVIEIWNLVFIQFNRATDGKLSPLPAKHVDTGMGFERVTAVLQGHNNNYGTDVFVPIVQALERMTGHVYGERHEGTQARRHEGHSPPSQGGAGGTSNSPPSQGGAGGGSDSSTGATRNPPVVPPARGDGAVGGRYAAFEVGNMKDEACRVIADHARCLTFALTDGAVPDREGRGYVLRRILRRAVRFGWQYLDLHKPFLCDLVDVVVDTMGDAFPELRKNTSHVKEIIREEEESFERTLERGIFEFDAQIDRSVDELIQDYLISTVGQYEHFEIPLGEIDGTKYRVQLEYPNRPEGVVEPRLPSSMEFERVGDEVWKLDSKGERQERVGAFQLTGQVAFTLHDTYGFPIDLTQVMAVEKGLVVDSDAYEQLMEQARERARGAHTEVDETQNATRILREHIDARTDDQEKYRTESVSATYMFPAGLADAQTDIWTADGLIGLVFDRTCFYAEAGGQVGDRGTIVFDNGVVLDVRTTKQAGDLIVHVIDPSRLSPSHTISPGQTATLTVDSRRRATMKNHTATHIMNWALREVLGEHVQQKGSLVDHEKTRFDLSNPKALTVEQIERVEQLVNGRIAQKLDVDYEVVPQQDALKINGLRAVFGERYPDMVRVMSIGVPVEDLLKQPDNPEWQQYSIEFCGGTHLKNTAEIEHFAIVSEEAVAKGIRRVVGVTGDVAREAEETAAKLVAQAESLRQASADAVQAGLAELQTTLPTVQIPVRQRHRLNELIGELQQIIKQQQKADAAGAAEIVKAEVSKLIESAEKIGDTTLVIGELPDVPVEQLKTGADMAKQKCGSAAILFGVRQYDDDDQSPKRERGTDDADNQSPKRERGSDVNDQSSKHERAGKAILLAAMTDDLVKKGLKAGDLVKQAAKQVKGGGGGPPTMAQAGGKDPDKLPEALAAGRAWLSEKL